MKSFFTIFIFGCSLMLNAQFTDAHLIHTTFNHSLEDIKTGDIDNDGYEDLVYSFDWNISWSKNLDGNGLWSASQLIESSYEDDRKIDLADLDGDGSLDVITIHNGFFETFVKWYKNDGNGNFGEAILIDVVEDNSSSVRKLLITSGDIDNDGDIDIAASFDMADGNLDIIQWYRNEDGLGNFSTSIEINNLIRKPNHLQLFHFNNDNFLDIVATLNNDSIIVHTGSSNGFTALDLVGFSSYELAGLLNADIDGDGDNDLIGNTKFTNDVMLYENLDNNGNFGNEQLLGLSEKLTSFFLCDTDDDNDLDVVFTDESSDSLGIIKNLGGGNYSDPDIFYSKNNVGPSNFVEIDYNGDGDKDIVVGGNLPDEYFIFENSDGQGDFNFYDFLNSGPTYLNDNMKMVDVNSDGYLDVVTPSDKPYSFSWMPYNPTLNIFEKTKGINIYSPFNIISRYISLDVNGDNAVDFAFFSNGSSGSKLTWIINDGNENFIEKDSLSNLGDSSDKLLAADLNNDGFDDLIGLSNASSGQGIFWFRNLGNNDFADGEFLYFGNSVDDVQIIDIDNDGFLDLVPLFYQGSEIGWVKNNGNSFEPWSLLVNNGSTIRDFIIHDFSQDGLLDIIVGRTSSNEIRFYKGNSPFSFDNDISFYPQVSSPNSFDFLDYDLDGLDDFIFIGSNDSVYWQKNLNTSPNPFDDEQTIYLETGTAGVFFIQDIDSDTDRDLIFSKQGELFCKKNIAANGKIIGKTFYDVNNNGTYELNEPHLNSFQFTLSPNNLLYFTANDTATTFFVPEGNYVLNSIPTSDWSLTTGNADFSINFVEDTIIQKEFGYFPNSLYSSVTSDLTSATTRCGFTVPFWLTYVNEGTEVNDGLIEVILEDFVDYVDAIPAPDSIVNDTLYWSYQSLIPTHSSSIKLQFEIAGVDFLGDSVKITTNTYTNSVNNILELSNSHQFISEINCAYDPNDKQVKPSGFLGENYTLFGEEFEFTIRFQNTGTDTAFNITITDVLDSKLDWSTFKVVSSSNLVETTLNPQNGLVNFYFPNILLPDSMVNEPESHGFLKYKIFPKTDLAEGTIIENAANIYFDFNPPIITNTTLNTLVSNYPINTTSNIIEPLCFNEPSGSIELSVEAFLPISYDWEDNNLSGSMLNNLNAGTYTVTITDGTGGSVIETYTLNVPSALTAALSSLPQDPNTFGEISIVPSGGTPPYIVNWNTDPPQTGDTISNASAGIYTAVVVDANNCIYIDSVEVLFITNLDDFDNQPEIKVYPNPTSENIVIDIQNRGQDHYKIKLMDISGKVIVKNINGEVGKRNVVELVKHQIEGGIYILLLENDLQKIFRKIVIIPKD